MTADEATRVDIASTGSTAGTAAQRSPIFNTAKFRNLAETRATDYAQNNPFPHIVFDDMLNVGKDFLEAFPPIGWDGWQGLGDTYQIQKFTCANIEMIPAPLVQLIQELSSPSFLKALEKLTGIEKLIPDPYLTGGGLHISGPGGILAPHTDFHIYDAVNLYRRVNVLVYLNEDWKLEWGGCLEMTAPNKPTATVLPLWGTTAIFTTDDKSVHGFPKPITDGHYRRSVALYYYTAEEAPGFSGDSTTHWREHGDQKGLARRLRFGLFKTLIQASRAFSLLAHLANPNQGGGWWKTRQARIAQEKRDQQAG